MMTFKQVREFQVEYQASCLALAALGADKAITSWAEARDVAAAAALAYSEALGLVHHPMVEDVYEEIEGVVAQARATMEEEIGRLDEAQAVCQRWHNHYNWLSGQLDLAVLSAAQA